MEQEIDYVTSCYGDDDLDFAKYAEPHHFFEAELENGERTRHSSVTLAATQTNICTVSSMIDSSNFNGSIISNKRSNSQQEADMKASFDELNQLNLTLSQRQISNPQSGKQASIDETYKVVEYRYENIFHNNEDSKIAFLHGEIPIQRQNIFSSCSDSEFMMGDVLQQYKKVNCLTQTSHFLHIELNSINQSSQSEINSITSQWEQEKIAERAWNNEQEQQNNANQVDLESNSSPSSSFDLTQYISQYLSTIAYRQAYFYQNQFLVDNYSQKYQNQDRFDNINKRAFKILKKLQQSPNTNNYTYKIIRKSPFEHFTVSRGVSNAFFDKLGLDKQEVSQYIMRSHSLPFSCEVSSQDMFQQTVEEVLSHNSFVQQSKTFLRTLQNGNSKVTAQIQQQTFALNEQLGDENIDINDYLVVEIYSFDNTQCSIFSQQMRERKQQFGFCFSTSNFHYKALSSNIVDRYYQNYSEQQRQENQIIRLLNKKNHRFH